MVLQILPIWHPTKPKPWTPPAMRYRRSLWWKIRKRKSPLVLPHTVRESIFGTWQRLKGHLSRNRTWYSLLLGQQSSNHNEFSKTLGLLLLPKSRLCATFLTGLYLKPMVQNQKFPLEGCPPKRLDSLSNFLVAQGPEVPVWYLDLAYQRFKLCLCCFGLITWRKIQEPVFASGCLAHPGCNAKTQLNPTDQTTGFAKARY